MSDDLEMEYYNTDSCPEKVYGDLCQEVMKCKKCDLGCEELLDGQNPHVMGEGDPESGIMFVAEAPGLQETIYHRPLTPPGTSGNIYEKVLAYLELSRDKVYATNIVLCRPPKNRDPEPWEVHRCKPYFIRQVGLVDPKIIVAFGRFAAQALLGPIKITRDHGKLARSDKFGVDVFPLYHPAYIGAYATKEKRAEFKEDIKVLKEILKGMT